jgi:enoyl-CoA hydratase/carnithine racemase
MSILEIERQDAVMVIRINRPDRLGALSSDLRSAMADAWCEFRDSSTLEVAIFTGTGRAFCAGEDMKESVERGVAGSPAALTRKENPYDMGTLDKPVIVAVNGYAMGGGFMLVERADLRVAVRGAIFESSEAKRWLLGGYDHGIKGRLPHALATEMAYAFRFTAERLYDVGFINRVVEPDQLMPTAHEMAAHLLTLPPASRINTTVMMHAVRPQASEELKALAARLHEHGARDDLMESRKAFAEKRKPNFKGWNDPQDRFRTPKLAAK